MTTCHYTCLFAPHITTSFAIFTHHCKLIRSTNIHAEGSKRGRLLTFFLFLLSTERKRKQIFSYNTCLKLSDTDIKSHNANIITRDVPIQSTMWQGLISNHVVDDLIGIECYLLFRIRYLKKKNWSAAYFKLVISDKCLHFTFRSRHVTVVKHSAIRLQFEQKEH